MAAGLEIYNADGTLQFSLDHRLLRTLTLVNTGTSDGSAVVAGRTQGDVIAAEVNPPTTGVTPVVTPTANGISWSFGGAAPADRRSVDLNILVF